MVITEFLERNARLYGSMLIPYLKNRSGGYRKCCIITIQYETS